MKSQIKIILFCVAIGAGLLSIFLYHSYKSEEFSLKPDFVRYRIKKPLFFGRSPDKKHYKVASETLVQIDKSKYELHNIQAEYYLTEDKSKYIILNARDGFFDETINLLELKEDLEITLSEGYRLLTQVMYVDFGKKMMYTSDEVTINGNAGNINSAAGMNHNLKKKFVEFYGPITSTLYDSARKTRVNVNSDLLTVDYQKKLVTYLGHVVATSKDMVMTCDNVEIYIADSKKKSGASSNSDMDFGSLKTIKFNKDVRIKSAKQIGRGDSGVFNPATRTITLQGNVSVKGEKNYMEGDKLVYSIDSDTYKIAGNKASKNKVRIILNG